MWQRKVRWGCVVMGGWGGGRAWGCVNAMISADQAMLLLIGTVETLGCLPLHSNEKPWPPLVSKVTKAYCNCTFSNGVSHARTPTPVMTITIMSPGSTGAFQSSVILGEGMLVSWCHRFKGCNTEFDYGTFTRWNLFLNHQGATDFIPTTQPHTSATWEGFLHDIFTSSRHSQVLALKPFLVLSGTKNILNIVK